MQHYNGYSVAPVQLPFFFVNSNIADATERVTSSTTSSTTARILLSLNGTRRTNELRTGNLQDAFPSQASSRSLKPILWFSSDWSTGSQSTAKFFFFFSSPLLSREAQLYLPSVWMLRIARCRPPPPSGGLVHANDFRQLDSDVCYKAELNTNVH